MGMDDKLFAASEIAGCHQPDCRDQQRNLDEPAITFGRRTLLPHSNIFPLICLSLTHSSFPSLALPINVPFSARLEPRPVCAKCRVQRPVAVQMARSPHLCPLRLSSPFSEIAQQHPMPLLSPELVIASAESSGPMPRRPSGPSGVVRFPSSRTPSWWCASIPEPLHRCAISPDQYRSA